MPFFLGEISYGVFCLHLLVLNAVLRQAQFGIFGGHFVAVWTLTAALSIALATVTYYTIERPCLRLKTWPRSGRSERDEHQQVAV